MIVGSIALGALIAPLLIATIGVRGALFAIGSLLPVLVALALAQSRADRRGRPRSGGAARGAARRAVPRRRSRPDARVPRRERLTDVQLAAGQTLFEQATTVTASTSCTRGRSRSTFPARRRSRRRPPTSARSRSLRDVPRTATVRARTDARSVGARAQTTSSTRSPSNERSLASADAIAVARLGAATA